MNNMETQTEKITKVLVVAPNYPSEECPVGLQYIHVRNKFYKDNGIDVTVLNFACDKGYVWDDIEVLSYSEYKKSDTTYDVLICHAPNIRKHYGFLKKHSKNFRRIILFFHGHEVRVKSKAYPKPYYFVKQNKFKRWLGDRYDYFKLFLWRRYLPKLASKSHFVFVSNSMHDEFTYWTKLTDNDLQNNFSVIHNSVGEYFEENIYDKNQEKIYDFITIRSVLDGSNYSVDLVVKLATENPDKKFLLVGRGEFFKFFQKPENVTWLDKHVTHEEIITLLNQSKCALMPTRTDSQGVMSCEIATFCMPLITSDIPVCHEIFGEFENVKFMQNDSDGVDIVDMYNAMPKDIQKNMKYSKENTIAKEVALIKSL